MDEILASIRRIIESSDDTSKSRTSVIKTKAVSEADRFRVETADEDRESSIFEASGRFQSPDDDLPGVPEFRSEPPPTDPREAVAESFEPAAGTAVPDLRFDEGDAYAASSLQHYHAPLDAASDDVDVRAGNVSESGSVAAVGLAREDTDAGVPATISMAPAAENENVATATDHATTSSNDYAYGASALNYAFEFDEAAFAEELRKGAGLESEKRTAAMDHGTIAEVFREPPAEPDAMSSNSVIASASALLSAQAGEQVAAAFDDLARAIRDGQMRSMEDMAREMLRPMLQEWLDDNLPRLVERLVREEIERIARGPRR